MSIIQWKKVNWECQQSDQKTFLVNEKASLYVSHKQIMWSRWLVICGLPLMRATTSQVLPRPIKGSFTKGSFTLLKVNPV